MLYKGDSCYPVATDWKLDGMMKNRKEDELNIKLQTLKISSMKLLYDFYYILCNVNHLQLAVFQTIQQKKNG